MIDLSNTTINMVKKSLKLYFEEKDIDYLLCHCVNDDIPMIGLVKPAWTNKITIVKDHYQFFRQSEKAFLVYGKITLAEWIGEDESVEREQNVTINCLYTENEIVFSSVHLSPVGEDVILKDVNANEIRSFYRDAFEKCYDVFVEYDSINNDFYYNKDGFDTLFERDTHFMNMDQMFWFICTECIHQDDCEKMDIFRNVDIDKRIRRNECKISYDVRIRNEKKGYKWVRMTLIMFPNSFFRLTKLIWLIKDIDDAKRIELNNMTSTKKDTLTGMFNKEYSEALVKYAMTEVTDVAALVLVHIDDFKEINDLFGRLTGDLVIKMISDKIVGSIDNTDIFGRLVANEFIIFIRNRQDIAEIEKVLNNIAQATTFRYEEDGNTYGIRVSMGVSVIDNAVSVFDEEYDKACAALANAKKNKKISYKLY